MTDSNDFKPSRRRFLRDLTTTAPAVAAAAALPTQLAAAAAETPQAQSKGYQLTQHVIDYYQSAAV